MTKHKTTTDSSKKPLVPEYLTPEPQGSVTAENVPDPTTVVALIGQEQRLMNLWVEGGTRALAEILEVPEDVLAKRWNRIKNHPNFLDGVIPLEAYSNYSEDLLWTRSALLKQANEKRSDFEYIDVYTDFLMPRPDLGWVSLTEYAHIASPGGYVKTALQVIDNYHVYKIPPRLSIDLEARGCNQQVLPNTVFSRYTGKALRFGRKYREAHKHLLAYPRPATRTHRVLWDKPEAYEGETYYPVEAIRGFSEPYTDDGWKVRAGERGGYVKEYDSIQRFSWVADSAHVKGKVDTGSLVAGNVYIDEDILIRSHSIISGDVQLNRRVKATGSKITGEVTIGTEGTTCREELVLYNATIGGKVAIDDNVKCIARATVSGDIELNGNLTVAGHISLTGAMVINSTGGYELYDSIEGKLDHKGNKPVYEFHGVSGK